LISTGNVTMPPPERPEQPPAGEHVIVSVTDTGSGMTDEVLAHAFEPFFTTKDVGKGSGLGLSQVFGLAKQSGGGVTIDTAVGQGTTITVYLPRATSAALAPAAAVTAPKAAPRPDLVVLVVDDDDAVREITAGILLDLGYRVFEAGSGGAALDMFNHRIDAVVLDFAMPGLNGADLARELRSRRPGVPILFATGYADADALADTPDDHIVLKPFRANDLAEKMALAVG
jgi:CheY-like chemotaxis protein